MTCCSTRLGGVGFRKGCYVGQEVVSRMQHRGTARRRVLIVAGDERPAGDRHRDLGRRTQHRHARLDCRDGAAWRIVRIDRVKDAMDAGTPILAGDVAVTLTIPACAKFTFPQPAAADEA